MAPCLAMIASTVSPQQAVNDDLSLFAFRSDRQERAVRRCGSKTIVSPERSRRAGRANAFQAPSGSLSIKCEGDFDGGSAGFTSRTVAAKLGGKNLGVVEHHDIAGAQKRG